MKRMLRYLKGDHTPKEIRWHLVILTGGFWGLVLLARLGYPPANHYSITRNMLSALGCFDARCNPQWFWLFSLAMVYCGFVMAPVMLYIRRHMKIISSWRATVGSIFFLAGSLAIALTGFFPYSRTVFLGAWRWADIHGITAVSIGVFFSIGAIWHASLLVRDRIFHKRMEVSSRWGYLVFFPPFLIVLTVFVVIGIHVQWGLFFQSGATSALDTLMKATAKVQSQAIIEHISIWGLTLFVVTFAALIPSQTPIPGRDSEENKNPLQVNEPAEGS